MLFLICTNAIHSIEIYVLICARSKREICVSESMCGSISKNFESAEFATSSLLLKSLMQCFTAFSKCTEITQQREDRSVSLPSLSRIDLKTIYTESTLLQGGDLLAIRILLFPASGIETFEIPNR